jgi:membrane protein
MSSIPKGSNPSLLLKGPKSHKSSFLNWESRLRLLVLWSKKVSFPGFSEIPLYDVGHFIYEELKKDDIVTRSNSVAFSFFLSIFPFIIFVLPLLSLTPWAIEYMNSLENSMNDVFPLSAKQYFLEIINSIKAEGTPQLRVVSLVFSALFASSGMLTLMHGFDKSYEDSFKHRNYLRKRLVALNLTFLLFAIFLVSLVMIVLGQQLLQNLIVVLFTVFKWIIVFILFYIVITVIYRYGPSIFRPLKLINPGATFATVLAILASVGFSYFINNFGRYNEIYGSIGALIVILLWLQINAFIILAGFELNASIIVNRDLIYWDRNNKMSQ